MALIAVLLCALGVYLFNLGRKTEENQGLKVLFFVLAVFVF